MIFYHMMNPGAASQLCLPAQGTYQGGSGRCMNKTERVA